MLQKGDSATAATGRMLQERVTIAATLAHRIPGFGWEKAENILQVATGVEEDDVTNEEIIQKWQRKGGRGDVNRSARRELGDKGRLEPRYSLHLPEPAGKGRKKMC